MVITSYMTLMSVILLKTIPRDVTVRCVSLPSRQIAAVCLRSAWPPSAVRSVCSTTATDWCSSTNWTTVSSRRPSRLDRSARWVSQHSFLKGCNLPQSMLLGRRSRCAQLLIQHFTKSWMPLVTCEKTCHSQCFCTRYPYIWKLGGKW